MEIVELPLGLVVKSVIRIPGEAAQNLGRAWVEQHRRLVHAILGAIAQERRAHVEEQIKQDKRAHALQLKV